MTHRNGAARSADVLGRWRELAEQRLEHLTELFESGRWRRYYGELAFLENIREAKVAVETWRGLSTPRVVAEPVIRVTAEGDDQTLVEDVVDGVVEALNQVAA